MTIDCHLGNELPFAAVAKELEILYAELFEAAGAGRRMGEAIASRQRQTQGRWQAMWTIGDMPLTVPQIARRLGMTRQNIQRVAGELIERNLATFVPNPDHKRSPLLRLTAEGRSTLDGLNATANRWHQAMLATFTADDVAALRTLLQRFVAAMRDLDDFEG